MNSTTLNTNETISSKSSRNAAIAQPIELPISVNPRALTKKPNLQRLENKSLLSFCVQSCTYICVPLTFALMQFYKLMLPFKFLLFVIFITLSHNSTNRIYYTNSHISTELTYSAYLNQRTSYLPSRNFFIPANLVSQTVPTALNPVDLSFSRIITTNSPLYYFFSRTVPKNPRLLSNTSADPALPISGLTLPSLITLDKPVPPMLVMLAPPIQNLQPLLTANFRKEVALLQTPSLINCRPQATLQYHSEPSATYLRTFITWTRLRLPCSSIHEQTFYKTQHITKKIKTVYSN
jgi:hypothetical protein